MHGMLRSLAPTNRRASLAYLRNIGEVGPPYRLLYVFRAKRADRLKLLVFDGTGTVLATKWMEERKFAWPPVQGGVMRLTTTQLTMLLEGLGEWMQVAVKPTKRPTKVG
jgi:transposase